LNAQINGHQGLSTNGLASPAAQSTNHTQPEPRPLTEDNTNASGNHITDNTSETIDTSNRLEAMSQDREALRAEVEQLRKSLEDLKTKHDE
jgi:predicted RNase H-like nuclease (RuvC/YqgF family)